MKVEMKTADQFMNACLACLAKPLSDLGYTYAGVHTRPRGIAVEFKTDSDLLFVVLEEDTMLIFDLILQAESKEYWRVDLNQALWFNGSKFLVDRALSIEEKLCNFSNEIPTKLTRISTNRESAKDARYWFPVSASGLETYLKSQRGRHE